MTLPPAGWHPNPDNENELRYWDGSQWTEHTSPVESGNTASPKREELKVPETVVPTISIEDQISSIVSSPQPESSMFSRKDTIEKLLAENSVFRTWASEIGIADRERFKKEAENEQISLGQTRVKLAAELKGVEYAHSSEIENLAKKHDKAKNALEKERLAIEQELSGLRQELVETREEHILQEAGIYSYHSELESSLEYQVRIVENKENIKEWVKSGHAVKGATDWTVNGSVKQGQKMIKEFSKLMLRAYNAEADDAVRTVKPHTLINKVERLTKTVAIISKLGATMGIRISDEYNRVRVHGLQLKADYLAKLEVEKEAEREEKERLREEAKMLREIEREMEKFEKEKSHYESVIQALREEGNIEAAEEKEKQLREIQEKMTALEDRKTNVRVGYVYVISNIGAFGERMVKIGMTRRLEPMDRVRELGDASVPFRYDVHALIFSEDAVALETSLHHEFADQRVNLVNTRREFFYVTPAEVKSALEKMQQSGSELTSHMLSFEEWAQAEEFRVSQSQSAPSQSEQEELVP